MILLSALEGAPIQHCQNPTGSMDLVVGSESVLKRLESIKQQGNKDQMNSILGRVILEYNAEVVVILIDDVGSGHVRGRRLATRRLRFGFIICEMSC